MHWRSSFLILFYTSPNAILIAIRTETHNKKSVISLHSYEGAVRGSALRASKTIASCKKKGGKTRIIGFHSDAHFHWRAALVPECWRKPAEACLVGAFTVPDVISNIKANEKSYKKCRLTSTMTACAALCSLLSSPLFTFILSVAFPLFFFFSLLCAFTPFSIHRPGIRFFWLFSTTPHTRRLILNKPH